MKKSQNKMKISNKTALFYVIAVTFLLLTSFVVSASHDSDIEQKDDKSFFVNKTKMAFEQSNEAKTKALQDRPFFVKKPRVIFAKGFAEEGINYYRAFLFLITENNEIVKGNLVLVDLSNFEVRKKISLKEIAIIDEQKFAPRNLKILLKKVKASSEVGEAELTIVSSIGSESDFVRRTVYGNIGDIKLVAFKVYPMPYLSEKEENKKFEKVKEEEVFANASEVEIVNGKLEKKLKLNKPLVVSPAISSVEEGEIFSEVKITPVKIKKPKFLFFKLPWAKPKLEVTVETDEGIKKIEVSPGELKKLKDVYGFRVKKIDENTGEVEVEIDKEDQSTE